MVTAGSERIEIKDGPSNKAHQTFVKKKRPQSNRYTKEIDSTIDNRMKLLKEKGSFELNFSMKK